MELILFSKPDLFYKSSARVPPEVLIDRSLAIEARCRLRRTHTLRFSPTPVFLLVRAITTGLGRIWHVCIFSWIERLEITCSSNSLRCITPPSLPSNHCLQATCLAEDAWKQTREKDTAPRSHNNHLLNTTMPHGGSPLRALANIISEAVAQIDFHYTAAQLQFPLLEDVFNPTDPSNLLLANPEVIRNMSFIVAAAEQLVATVRPPAMVACDMALVVSSFCSAVMKSDTTERFSISSHPVCKRSS